MVERFKVSVVARGERPARIYEYYVSGKGYFAFDMLRYDACWPATSEDADNLMYTLPVDFPGKIRSVKMRSYKEPTIDRWASFGWSVGMEKL